MYTYWTINNGKISIYIEFIYYSVIIFQMIEMCIHIRDRWSSKKLLLAATELDVMEHSYIKYHTYLALALHNAVQHKDADYCKFYNLLTMFNLFQYSCPSFCSSINRS